MPQRIDVPGMGIVEFPDGMSDEAISSAIKSNLAEQPSVAGDIAKSAAIGIPKGLIASVGAGGDVRSLLSRGTDYLGEQAGFAPETIETVKNVASRVAKATPLAAIAEGPTSADIQKGVEGYTGDFYQPQTRPGKFTGAVSETLSNPTSYLGAGGLPIKLATGVTSAVGSEGAGQLTEGSRMEGASRIAGALMGSLAPSVAGRVITPIRATPVHQGLVEDLRNEGVTSLTAGQRTGDRSLKYLEDMLGNAPGAGQSAANITRRGQEQFTEAAMRRSGAGPDATPEVLAANQRRLGNEFEQLSARNTMTPDNQFITDVTTAVRHYRNVPNSQQAQMIQGYIDDIMPHINAGGMPGAEYQAMRSRMSRQANRLRQSDPDLSEALRDIRNALDNAMGRSISPADREAWQAARREYGAQKTIEKTASRAGEATAEGQLVPSNLRNTVSAENRGAYARGEGQFSALAHAGEGAMKPLPNSGTGQRLGYTDIARIPINATIGRLLMSRPAQAYLGNQALTGLGTPSKIEAMARALMTAPGVR